MDLKKLLGLRPKETTAAALAETRERIEREAGELGKRIAELQRTRGERLLDSEPMVVERAEAELKVAEEERARLTAMLQVLREREAAAERQEKAAAVQRLHDDAQVKLESFVTWWREEYPKHAQAIAYGLRLELDVLAAQRAAAVGAERHGVLVERAAPSPKISVLPGLSYAEETIGAFVMLPPAESPEGTRADNIWPPRFDRGSI